LIGETIDAGRGFPSTAHPSLHPLDNSASNTAMHNGILPRSLVMLAWLAGWVLVVGREYSVSGAEPADPVVVALHAVVMKNLSHARDLLEQRDRKSLAQSAGSVVLLNDLLRARSDDAAWQTALNIVDEKASDLKTAAGGQEDFPKCEAALKSLEAAAKAAAAIQPTGKPRALPSAPPIRALMLTMDGIQADAKIALITGNVEMARKQAFVLAELSRLVSNSRTGDKWSSLAGDFTKAAQRAATSTETDPKNVRQLFRGVSQQCETCHESSRAR
jgi:hypothetical protein